MPDVVPASGFALVRMPVAPLHTEPRVSSAQTSQALFGRVVWIERREGDWLRVRTAPDGYPGWMHAGYLRALDGEAPPADAAQAPERALAEPGVRVSLGCTVRAGERVLHLPLGAWVAAGVPVLDGDVAPMHALAERFPHDGGAVVRTAQRYFGSTSYQWGGLTPWGADCSGMVQTVYALHGADLPRDAWQQAACGADAGPDLAAHAPGDLLFFSDRDDRRITHVGIAAGDGTMCHVALGRGGWAVDALADSDDPYAARLRPQLVTGRRVLR